MSQAGSTAAAVLSLCCLSTHLHFLPSLSFPLDLYSFPCSALPPWTSPHHGLPLPAVFHSSDWADTKTGELVHAGFYSTPGFYTCSSLGRVLLLRVGRNGAPGCGSNSCWDISWGSWAWELWLGVPLLRGFIVRVPVGDSIPPQAFSRASLNVFLANSQYYSFLYNRLQTSQSWSTVSRSVKLQCHAACQRAVIKMVTDLPWTYSCL